jgi:phospholipase/carboxylesterase
VNGVTLAHLVRPPAVPSPRPPLVVLLHGVGADEDDLFGLAPHLDPRLLVVSARGPYPAPPAGFGWYAIDWSTRPPTIDPAQAEASRAAVGEFVEEVTERHGTDPARTFLFGFSQGAIVALGVALGRPDLVRGVVAHSGRLLPQFLARAAPPPAFERVDALLLHGTEDEVVPITRGREARDLLAPLLGARLAFREYPIGHGISPESLGAASAWLSARLGPGTP